MVWRVGGRAADESRVWGRATAEALRSGSPAFNAATAVLQAISLAKLPETLTYGTEQERRVAIVANTDFAYRMHNGMHVAWNDNAWWRNDDGTRMA